MTDVKYGKEVEGKVIKQICTRWMRTAMQTVKVKVKCIYKAHLKTTHVDQSAVINSEKDAWQSMCQMTEGVPPLHVTGIEGQLEFLFSFFWSD